MSIQEQIAEARKLNKPLLLKGVLADTPDWNYVMDYVNTKFNESPKRDFGHPDFLINKEGITVPMFRSGFFDLQLWDIDTKECKELSNIVNPNASIDSSAFKILIDFLGTNTVNSIHKDYAEVYSWTWLNSVEYRVYEDKDYPYEQGLGIHDQPYESYVIEAGDVMYMPKGIVHQSVITDPRVSLIVSVMN